MCMQDYIDGRKLKGTFRMVAMGAAAVLLAPANKNRVLLSIAAFSNTTVSLGPDSSVAINTGTGLTITGHDFELDIRKHGDLVTKELWGISSAPGTIGIIETFLYEQR